MEHNYDYILTKLSFILSKNDMDRISLISKDEMHIIVDVHGMKCLQAKKFINNIINVVRIVFRLIIIHGHNHGTAIKDMLSQNFCNAHVSEKHLDPYNQGVTHMIITA